MQQHSGGCARVTRSPMALHYLNSEVLGERVEMVLFEIRHQTPGQLYGAYFRVAHPASGEDSRDLLIQQIDIETGIVRRQYCVTGEVQPTFADFGESRRRRQHFLCDSG